MKKKRLRGVFSKHFNDEAYDESVRKLLIERMDVIGDCWVWNSTKMTSGHGRISYRGKYYLAHRLAWCLFKKHIAKGRVVSQKCKNCSCINPQHLFLKSQRIYPKREEGRPLRVLTEENVLEIRELIKQNLSKSVIAKRFGICYSHVSAIKSRKVWRNI